MGYRDLAFAIVTQAVEDYIERKSYGGYVGHLTKFFRSNYCDILLADLPITGEDIIRELKRRTA